MSSICLPSNDSQEGIEWAKKKGQSLVFWTVSISFKGEKISIPIQPSNPIVVCVEFLLDAYAGLDDSSVKILYKGRKLDMNKSFEEENVINGAKLMMIASSTVDVEKVKSSRSDPTIRGFDNEKKLSQIRQKGLDPANSSAWRSEQHKEFKFSKLEMASYEIGECTPHPYEAQALLLKLATDPGIIECMVTHQWHVSKLCEMDPRKDNIKKEGACTLGYNENYGARIYIRLRTDDLKLFRPYRELINTLLHELCHNQFGPHGTEFWSLFSKLKMSYLTCHANLQSKGTMVAGVSAGKLADISNTGDAQNMKGALSAELTASATNSALSPGEREAAAVVAARVALMESPQPSPPPLTSSHKRDGDARLAAAMAAEQRMKTASTSDLIIPDERDGMMKTETNVDQTVITKDNIEDLISEPQKVDLIENSHPLLNETIPEPRTSVNGDTVQSIDEDIGLFQGDQSNTIKDCIETLKVAKEFGDEITKQSAINTLNTLSKILKNILKDPNDFRYRKLRRTNDLFARTIGSSEPALEILNALGFNISQNDDEFVLENPDLRLCSETQKILTI